MIPILVAALIVGQVDTGEDFYVDTVAEPALPLTGGTLTGPLLLSNGVGSAPALAFASDTNTGLYRPGGDLLAIAAGGLNRLSISSVEIALTVPLNTYTTYLHSTSGILKLGGSMTSTHALGSGATGVAGPLEVDGVAYFDSTVIAAGIITAIGLKLGANNSVNNGTTDVGGFIPFSVSQTPDASMLATGSLSNSFIIAEFGDYLYDFGHPLQANPTLWWQSAAQSLTEWASAAHIGTAFKLATGAGIIDLEPAAKGLGLPAIVGTDTPVEPVSCTAANAGVTTYVDETDDSAAAQVCICAATGDDGAGVPTMDWRKLDDLGTACGFF